MGSEIEKSYFTNEDFAQFKEKLFSETRLLSDLIGSNQLNDDGFSSGVEIEGWLVDQNNQPLAINQWFLKELNDPRVTHELSKYNIEINGSPFKCTGSFLNEVQSELDGIWQNCQNTAERLNAKAVLIGSLPNLNVDMFKVSSMTPSKRYEALNSQVISLRPDSKKNSLIHITGNETLHFQTDSLLPASACTSLQVQFKVPISKFTRFMNATQVLSPASVVLSANSPYLFGKDLWQESRIALFEHSLNHTHDHENTTYEKRAFFAKQYLQDSAIEFYKKNLEFEPLLPFLYDSKPEEMKHLNLHNGTIWRWNRPVVGFEASGQAHLRIEHRPLSAGPTVVDAVANLAFFIGCCYEMATGPNAIESDLDINTVKENFYAAAKKGFASKQQWLSNRSITMKDLLEQILIPMAKVGLKKLNFDNDSIEYYLNEIIFERTKSEQNGANWQRKSAHHHGGDLDYMTERYIVNLESGEPVHKWPL